MLDLFDFQNFKTNLYVIPIFLLGSWLACQIWIVTAVMHFISLIPLHELGHAFVAWMGGRFAFPAGALVPSAAMTFISAERSLLFSLLFWTVLFFAAMKAYRQRYFFWAGTAVLIFWLSLWMTLGLTNSELSIWISYGGIAGEFWIGAWLVLAFFHPFYPILRWEFFRYPALAMGSFSFVHAFEQWRKIMKGLAQMPLGTAMSSDGAQDPHGDLNILLSSGWTTTQIIERYLMLGRIGLLLIAISYFYFLLKTKE